jgi:hypothetical protein
MTDTFKTLNQTLGTSNTTVYSVPATANAIVTLGQLANIDGSVSADAYVYVTDNASGNTRALVFKTPVPAGAATTFVTGKLALRPNDSISAKASAASNVDITVSVIEIT